MKMQQEGIYKNAFFEPLKTCYGHKGLCTYVIDGGGPKDSENTLNSFLITNKEKVFWKIGADVPRQGQNQTENESFPSF